MASGIPAGPMRHRITLEAPAAPVEDGDGGYTEVPAGLTPRTVWASIAPATARSMERVAASSVQASATHLVRIRHHAGVTTETRVTFKGRSFSVISVQNQEERNVEMVLTCVENVA